MWEPRKIAANTGPWTINGPQPPNPTQHGDSTADRTKDAGWPYIHISGISYNMEIIHHDIIWITLIFSIYNLNCTPNKSVVQTPLIASGCEKVISVRVGWIRVVLPNFIRWLTTTISYGYSSSNNLLSGWSPKKNENVSHWVPARAPQQAYFGVLTGRVARTDPRKIKVKFRRWLSK